jgi:hypothetical protein
MPTSEAFTQRRLFMAEKQEDPKATVTVGGRAAKTWHVFNRPNATAAVTWLNSPPAQQAGEAMVSNRSDGTVDAYAFF